MSKYKIGKNPFELGKKNFTLALGMGPYFGPMRALEKRPVAPSMGPPGYYLLLIGVVFVAEFCENLSEDVRETLIMTTILWRHLWGHLGIICC